MANHRRTGKRITNLICDQCGASIPTTSRFCQECGAPVVQRPAPRVRVRDEYAQRVFTFGCLLAVLAAVVAGFVIGVVSRFLGIVVAVGIILAAIIFMRILFGGHPRE